MSESATSGAVTSGAATSGASVPGAAASDAAGMSVAAAFAGMRSVSPMVFRAGCPDCRGRFELTASALRLAIGATSKTTFYSFTCPDCGVSVRKPAGERIVELLTGGGVRTLRLHSTL
ncbi:hypothetical protein SAMN06272735_1668 [Streptomyces sp. TLI_55]|nr:hypothetical protein SAMN06272735_1668 [Streptomyces sp. TLI_55]